MKTSELIKQAEELLGKCSDGPWLICVYGDSYSIGSKDKYNILVDRNENIKANPDSDFIIFARNHMQELIDRVKEIESAARHCLSVHEDAACSCSGCVELGKTLRKDARKALED